nr:multicopper oxidase domain-containing protein [Chloroflexia bacterium]
MSDDNRVDGAADLGQPPTTDRPTPPPGRSVQPVSRRRFAAGGAFVGGALLLGAGAWRSATAQDATHEMDPLPAATLPRRHWQPADLTEPAVRRAVAGVLRTDLRLAYLYHDIGGYRLHLRGYDGGIPGPTLRARPGDVLRIGLGNDLPPNADPLPLNGDLPHHFNTTNLHVHGLHVSPAGIADNVFRSMEPGQRYDIEIPIPVDHPSGTFWYHPHHHGSADIQLTSGMAGALVVEGDFAEVPEIAAARERVLILSEVLFDHLGAIEHYETVWPEAVPRFLAVNGQRQPILRMRPGEVQRWRLIQAAHESNLRLPLDGHVLHTIAADGIQAPRMASEESLLCAPGQRVDVLVQAGGPGTYGLAAVPNDQGYPSPTGPLAWLVVEGEPRPMALPAALPAPPLPTIRDDELTGSRRLTLSAVEPEFPPAADYQEFSFLIDDKRFDHDRVDQRVNLGAVEEWMIVNEHHDDHVFHIHTNPFQVTRINGARLAEPVWQDTVVVPRDGSVTYRSRFLDFTGKLVLHCHMMNHEELGMMQTV